MQGLATTEQNAAQALIRQFLQDPKSLQLPKLQEPPPGQPIGDEEEMFPHVRSVP